MAQPYVPPCQEPQIRAEPCPAEAGREPDRATKRTVLAACILASSMAFIDGSALTVALPALAEDFSGNLQAVQWVLNGYVLALAALTMVGGSLADTYGRARVLALGCAGFALASVACALSPNAASLIAARIAQGAAAAIVTPASLALIGQVFPKSERSTAIGTWAAASALTTAGGPILGGWLTETFGWPAIFWMNIPLAAVAIALLGLARLVPFTQPRPFDGLGALLLALTLAAFAMGLSAIAPSEGGIEAASPHETGPAISFYLAASLLGLALFALSQRRSTHPMLPGYILKSRAFNGLNLATLFLYAGLSVMFFLVPFELIAARGLTASEAGLAFLPFTLAVGLLSRPFGAFADRFGTRPALIAGPLLAAIGFALMARGGEAGLGLGILAPMTVAGLGFALLVAPLTSAVMASVANEDEGLASGINNTASRIAQLIGVAAAAAFAALPAGFAVGLDAAALLCVIGAALAAFTLPGAAPKPAE